MKKLVLAVTLLALSSLSFAGDLKATKINTQQEATAALNQKNVAQTVPHGVNSTSTCSKTFTSGVGNTFLQYCVTVNGNIPQVQTPFGHEHVAVGTFGEGYGICDANTLVEYDDWAGSGDTGNWGAPVETFPNATTTKVVRSTSDGIWTLTQVITQSASTSSIKITMTLKNNTAIARRAFTIRYVDIDADSVFANNFDATKNSSFGNNSGGFGLMLQNVGNPAASNGWISIAQNVPNGPTPCNIFTHEAEPTTATDGSVVLLYDNTFAAHASQTYTMMYKGL
jgi:hypothetical protein